MSSYYGRTAELQFIWNIRNLGRYALPDDVY